MPEQGSRLCRQCCSPTHRSPKPPEAGNTKIRLGGLGMTSADDSLSVPYSAIVVRLGTCSTPARQGSPSTSRHTTPAQRKSICPDAGCHRTGPRQTAMSVPGGTAPPRPGACRAKTRRRPEEAAAEYDPITACAPGTSAGVSGFFRIMRGDGLKPDGRTCHCMRGGRPDRPG